MNTTFYSARLFSAALIVSCLPLAQAQDQMTPKEGVKTAEVSQKMEKLSAEELNSRKASIPLIEERIKDRKEQITVVAKDMERLNSRIEKRIDKIVSTLESMKDSQNSKVRVAKMKQDVMMGLGKSIKSYNQRRAELKEMLRSGQATVGDGAAQKGVQAFDAKIEKRVGQLVSLSESFTKHEDYEKYVNDGGGADRYGNTVNNRNDLNWGWDNSRVNEEWKQNRRETVFTRTQHKKMIAALKASIDDLERRTNTLRNKSKESGVSEETKKFYQEDIARNEVALASRSKQLSELVQPGQKSKNTQSVSRNEAHDTELLIREVVKDINRDGNEMTRDYNDLKVRLGTLQKMKKNLEARKTWLEKYEAMYPEKAE